MNLYTLLNTKQNFDKIFKEQLLKMDCFFQEHLWNGFDDEDDPKFISKEDFEAIEALTDKIEHMTCIIGCPISVRPMLESIANRKIKHWQADDNIETKNKTEFRFNKELGYGKEFIIGRAFKKGRQLKSKNDIKKVYKHDGYNHIPIEKRVISGHFRWNNRGYILTRRATDLLLQFLETKFI